MTVRSHDQITTVQLAMIIANAIIGAGMVTLPRDIGTTVGTPDAWISVILGGVISLFFGYVVARLSQRFPGQNFYQYSEAVVGKFLGRIHVLLLIVYFALIGAWQVRAMGELVRMYLLNNTPIEVIMIVFIWLGVYLVEGGVRPIGRLCELYFPIIAFILLLTFVLAWRDFKLDNIRPVLGEGIVPVLKGLKNTGLALTGFEVVLCLSVFTNAPQKIMRAVLIGIAMIIPLYTLEVFTTIGSLTIDEVNTLTWPLMSLAKAIDLPGGFFERFESLLSVIWVIANYTTFVPFYYCSCLGLGQLFRKDYRIFMYGLLPVIYLIAIYPQDLNSIFKVGNFNGFFGVFIATIMPLYFLIIAMARRKGIENK